MKNLEMLIGEPEGKMGLSLGSYWSKWDRNTTVDLTETGYTAVV
jgi:hypothetical protein